MSVGAGSATTQAAPPRAYLNRRVLLLGLLVVLPLLGVLLVNLGRDPHAVRSPLVGRPAPPFALAPAGGGAPVTLASLRGRPVVLNFWATWCQPCFQEHPVLTRTAAEKGRDVTFLGVIYQDEEQRVVEFLQRQGAAYPSLLDPDSKAAIAYGVAGVPETYFIDKDGVIADKFVGPLSDETMAEMLRKAQR